MSRPTELSGTTYKKPTPPGTAYITVNDRDEEPYEVFIRVGKSGATLYSCGEALGRVVSLALQRNIPVEDVYEQLRGIAAEEPLGLGPNKVLSLPDAVAQVLAEHTEES